MKNDAWRLLSVLLLVCALPSTVLAQGSETPPNARLANAPLRPVSKPAGTSSVYEIGKDTVVVAAWNDAERRSTFELTITGEPGELVHLAVSLDGIASARSIGVFVVPGSGRLDLSWSVAPRQRALLEGLQSGPAEEWTSQEWTDIKQRVIDRHQGS